MVPAQVHYWKKQKNKNVKKRLLKLVFLIIVIFIAVNLATKIPKIAKFFTQPFDRLSGDKLDNEALDFTYRSNFLLLTYLSDQILLNVALVSYEPKDKNITFINFDLPNNTQIRKRVNSIFRNDGVGQVQKYISLGLFVPIDRYVAVEKVEFSEDYLKKVKEDLKLPSVIFKAAFLDEIFGPKLKTNMSSKEFLDFLFKLRDSNGFVYKKIETPSLPDRQVLASLQNQFIDNKIIDEGASVILVNGSGQSGLASILKGYITNLGAYVVSIEDLDRPVEKSSVIIRNNKEAIISRIKYILDYEKKTKENNDFSGDILILIGKDAIERLTLEVFE